MIWPECFYLILCTSLKFFLKTFATKKNLLINTEMNTNTDNNSFELGHNVTYLKDILFYFLKENI